MKEIPQQIEVNVLNVIQPVLIALVYQIISVSTVSQIIFCKPHNNVLLVYVVMVTKLLLRIVMIITQYQGMAVLVYV